MSNRKDNFVARFGAASAALLMVLFVHAKTPLPTQFIAPVDAPNLENAVLRTAYGQDQGFIFERSKDPFSIGRESGYNYSLSIGGSSFNAYDRLIKKDYYGHEPVGTIVRSVTAKARNMAPARRYLYNTPAATGDVFDPAWTDVSNATYVENLAINNGFDSTRHDSHAVYVQGVHTDWVYTVTFDANGGSGTMPSQTITNSAMLATNIFTKSGHTFDGWATSPGGAKAYDDRATVSSDLTLYARWKARGYMVVFFAETGVAEMFYRIGESGNWVKYDEAFMADSGSRVFGYAVAAPGYTAVNTRTSPWSEVVTIANLSATLSATANVYTITFNPVGGSVTPTTTGATYGAKYPDLPTPTHTNTYATAGYITSHAFAGWYTAQNGGEQRSSSDTYSIVGDQTLYAHWTTSNAPKRYMLAFDGCGATDGSMQSLAVTYGEELVLDACGFKRSGYDFSGWSRASDETARYTDGAKIKVVDDYIKFSSYTNNATVVLYAKWSARQCAVAFDGNGGSSPSSKNVAFGGNYGFLADSSWTGHEFAGWWTAKEGGEQVTAGTKVTNPNDHTLYAHWTYTVTVSPNGGSGGSCPSYVTSTGSQTKTLTPPTRKGYSISSWTVSGALGGTPTVSGNTLTIPGGTHGNLTLTPTWTANSYTVTFNANGGETPTPATKRVTYGSAYGDPAKCERDGYQFDGWWTDPEEGDKIENDTKVTITSDQILYAHWATYTLTLYGNEGLVGGSSKTNLPCILNAPYPELPEAVRAGYQFAGWWTDAAYTNGVQKTTNDLVTVEARTLYARWKTPSTAATCTVTLNPGEEGTGGEKEVEYTVGAALGDLPAPTPKDGAKHLFFGWYDPPGNVVTRDTVVESNLTLTAKWSEKKFNDALGINNLRFTTKPDHPWTVDEEGVHSGMVTNDHNKSDLEIDSPASGCVEFAVRWNMPEDVTDAFFGWKTEKGDVVEDNKRWGIGSEVLSINMHGFLVLSHEAAWGKSTDRAWLDSLTWTPASVPTAIDEWDSAVALSQAPTNAVFETGGSADWAVTTKEAEFAEGENGIASVTNLPHGRSTWARMTVNGSGCLSFKWKVSSEKGYVGADGRYVKCDYLEFCDGERAVGFIDGETGFATFVHMVETGGSHTFTWRYVKDGTDVTGADRGFVDAVTWTPAVPEGDGAYTIRFRVPDELDRPGDMNCSPGKVYKLPDLPAGYKWRRLDVTGRIYDGGLLVFNLTDRARLEMEAVRVP